MIAYKMFQILLFCQVTHGMKTLTDLKNYALNTIQYVNPLNRGKYKNEVREPDLFYTYSKPQNQINEPGGQNLKLLINRASKMGELPDLMRTISTVSTREDTTESSDDDIDELWDVVPDLYAENHLRERQETKRNRSKDILQHALSEFKSPLCDLKAFRYFQISRLRKKITEMKDDSFRYMLLQWCDYVRPKLADIMNKFSSDSSDTDDNGRKVVTRGRSGWCWNKETLWNWYAKMKDMGSTHYLGTLYNLAGRFRDRQWCKELRTVMVRQAVNLRLVQFLRNNCGHDSFMRRFLRTPEVRNHVSKYDSEMIDILKYAEQFPRSKSMPSFYKNDSLMSTPKIQRSQSDALTTQNEYGRTFFNSPPIRMLKYSARTINSMLPHSSQRFIQTLRSWINSGGMQLRQRRQWLFNVAFVLLWRVWTTRNITNVPFRDLLRSLLRQLMRFARNNL